ncbi:MAG: hypothetical protein ACM3OC_01415 [Deltaproteobacteria bacterium]
MIRRTTVLLLALSLSVQQTGFCQMAGLFDMSAAATSSAGARRPVHLRYLSYDRSSGAFNVSVDAGTAPLSKTAIREKIPELLRFFLVGLALPDDVFWVNLRPDSPDRMLDPLLEKTDVGRIMLEADLQLKKDLASLTSPESRTGREYWNAMYRKAEDLMGSREVTIPTLTRPWIVPGEIVIARTEKGAYIYKALLQVKLEQDRLAGSAEFTFKDERLKELNSYSSALIRKNILPLLEREVNRSGKYARLRQVYYSLVMAQWYKRNGGLQGLSSLADSRDLAGLESSGKWDKQEYFRAYRDSFEKGEYNRQENVQAPSGQSRRSYSSGGIQWMTAETVSTYSAGDVNVLFSSNTETCQLGFDMASRSFGAAADAAMADGGNTDPEVKAENLIREWQKGRNTGAAYTFHNSNTVKFYFRPNGDDSSFYLSMVQGHAELGRLFARMAGGKVVEMDFQDKDAIFNSHYGQCRGMMEAIARAIPSKLDENHGWSKDGGAGNTGHFTDTNARLKAETLIQEWRKGRNTGCAYTFHNSNTVKIYFHPNGDVSSFDLSMIQGSQELATLTATMAGGKVVDMSFRDKDPIFNRHYGQCRKMMESIAGEIPEQLADTYGWNKDGGDSNKGFELPEIKTVEDPNEIYWAAKRRINDFRNAANNPGLEPLLHVYYASNIISPDDPDNWVRDFRKGYPVYVNGLKEWHWNGYITPLLRTFYTPEQRKALSIPADVLFTQDFWGGNVRHIGNRPAALKARIRDTRPNGLLDQTWLVVDLRFFLKSSEVDVKNLMSEKEIRDELIKMLKDLQFNRIKFSRVFVDPAYSGLIHMSRKVRSDFKARDAFEEKRQAADRVAEQVQAILDDFFRAEQKTTIEETGKTAPKMFQEAARRIEGKTPAVAARSTATFRGFSPSNLFEMAHSLAAGGNEVLIELENGELARITRSGNDVLLSLNVSIEGKTAEIRVGRDIHSHLWTLTDMSFVRDGITNNGYTNIKPFLLSLSLAVLKEKGADVVMARNAFPRGLPRGGFGFEENGKGIFSLKLTSVRNLPVFAIGCNHDRARTIREKVKYLAEGNDGSGKTCSLPLGDFQEAEIRLAYLKDPVSLLPTLVELTVEDGSAQISVEIFRDGKGTLTCRLKKPFIRDMRDRKNYRETLTMMALMAANRLGAKKVRYMPHGEGLLYSGLADFLVYSETENGAVETPFSQLPAVPLGVTYEPPVSLYQALSSVGKDGGTAKGGKASDPGGIDFAAMTFSAPALLPPGTFFRPSKEVSLSKIEESWKQIRLSSLRKDIPYGKLQQYLLALRSRGDTADRIDQTVSFIAGLLRDEENEARPSTPEMRDLLSCLFAG